MHELKNRKIESMKSKVGFLKKFKNGKTLVRLSTERQKETNFQKQVEMTNIAWWLRVWTVEPDCQKQNESRDITNNFTEI